MQNAIMNMAQNLITSDNQQLNPLLDDIFEVVGIRDPEHLLTMSMTPGGVASALAEAVGFGSEISNLLGVTGDAVTGNVPGVVRHGAELHGVNPEAAGTIFELGGMLPI